MTKVNLPFDPDEIRRRILDYQRDARVDGRAFSVYLFAKPEFAMNPHILKWWSAAQDELIGHLITERKWEWYWDATKRILAITPPHTIETWKHDDPNCSHHAWYNVLMYFAISRALQLGLVWTIQKPAQKVCPLCSQPFVEDSLSPALVRRLGINHLDFCSPCLRSCTYPRTGNDSLSREDVLAYLQDLAAALQRVPSQGFGEGIHDFEDMISSERLAVFKVLQRKPTLKRVKDLFGSWLKALIEAGVLEDGARRASRGIHSLAKDGHICLSLGEKTIDDYLSARNIQHEREPHYPEGHLRADFKVNDIFIEYLGLTGNPEYDAKTKVKQAACKRLNIGLVLIRQADLVAGKLNAILGAIAPQQSN